MGIDIVISGISGRYPQADSLEEFWSLINLGQPLYGLDTVPLSQEWLTRRPKARACLKNPGAFDAEFFGFSHSYANSLDGQYRILHEVVYEALWDAGILPEQWHQTKTGFFVGSFDDDTERSDIRYADNGQVQPPYFATRIPDYFGFKGPTVRVDTACASSISALRIALDNIESGACDQAIVAGICVHQRLPVIAMARDLEMLSKTGRSLCMDAEADGYVRSEAVVALVLQRRQCAKRVYAEILSCCTNTDGYKPTGITAPSVEGQNIVITETMRKAGIQPTSLKYVEAHMTGTQIGDVNECKSILKSYRNNNSQPIMVGCLKSLLGHSEGASGAVAISKVAKIFQNSLIPPNAPLKTPNPRIEGLMSGQIVPVKEQTKFHHDIIPVNVFGFGGANGNILLKASRKKFADSQSIRHKNNEFPRLVLLCNRTEQGLTKMVDFLKCNQRAKSNDFMALLDELSFSSKMKYRTYLLLDGNQNLLDFGSHHCTTTSKCDSIRLVLEPACVNYFPNLIYLPSFKASTLDSQIILSRNSVPDQNLYITVLGILDLLSDLQIKVASVSGLNLNAEAEAYAKKQIDKAEFFSQVSRTKKLTNGLSQESNKNSDQDLVLQIGSRIHLSSKTFKQTGSNPLVSLLRAFGEMYTLGLNPKVSKLYPEFKFPVYRDCPSLGHLIDWVHARDYEYLCFPEALRPSNRSAFVVDLMDPDYTKASDHVIAGKVLFPATGFLYLIQKHLALMKFGFLDPSKISVRAWDVNIQAPAIVQDPITLHISHDPVTYKFEVKSEQNVHVTGFAKLVSDSDSQSYNDFIEAETDDIDLEKSDFYQLLGVRGYNYGDHYQNVLSIKANRGSGIIKFDDDWMAFADSLLQACIFWDSSKSLLVPTRIEDFRFDAKVFFQSLDCNRTFKVFSGRKGVIGGYGLVIKGLEATEFPVRNDSPNLLIGEQVFSPLSQSISLDMKTFKEREKYLFYAMQLWQNGKSSDEIDSFLEDNANATLLRYLKENVQNLKHEMPGPDEDQARAKLLKECVSDHVLAPPLECVASQIDLAIENKVGDQFVIETFGEMPTKMIQDMESMVSQTGKKFVVNKGKLIDPSQSKTKSDLSMIYDSSLDFCGGSNQLCNDSDDINISGSFLILIFGEKLTDFESTFLRERGLKSPTLSVDYLIKAIERKGYQRIGENKTSELGIKSILYRRPFNSPSKPTLIRISEDKFDWVDEIKTAVKSLSSENDRIWLVSEGSYLNGVVGLTKCLRLEPKGNQIRCAFVPSTQRGEFVLSDGLVQKDLAINVKINEEWGSFRVRPIKETPIKPTPHAYLEIQKRGSWETLKWHENDEMVLSLKQGTISESDLIAVSYSAINFRDTLLAGGRLPPDTYGYTEWIGFGSEFSGITQKGERVCGAVTSKGIATMINSEKALILAKIPDSWTLKDAATVPVCYSTVYYGLIVRGKMQPGETVLIHAGSGGVGLAAIRICLKRNCRVFVTVSNKTKMQFVQKIFPQLDDSCFADSRSSQFHDHILRQTDGRGVDLVLNFLTDDLLEAGLKLLSDNGRLIEIGKKDILDNHLLDMTNYSYNVSIEVACLGWALQNKEDTQKIIKCLENGINNGEVIPLPCTVYDPDKAKEVFTTMGKASHTGKLLIKFREEESEFSNKTVLSSVFRTVFDPTKSYLIIGGLGGMGLELIHWMVARGARKIVVTSRSGIKTNIQRVRLKQAMSYKNKDVNIVVHRVDVTNEKSTLKFIKDAAKLAPIGGIFNLAAVLSDGLMENQTVKAFEDVCAPKIKATRNLDVITRSHCPQLEHFVCFSSIASLGNLGQSNYGFANSFMERLCEQRRKDGLPGLAIQWGPVADVGMAHRIFKNSGNVAGFEPQKIESCLNTSLDLLMKLDIPIGWSAIRSIVSKRETGNALATISRILGTKDINVLNPKLTLRELGMDSVQSVEVHSYLERNFEVPVATAKVYDITLEQIVKIVSLGEPVTTETEEKEETILKPLKRGGGRPLFFFPPAVFDFLSMMPLALGMEREVYGIDISPEIHSWNDWKKITNYVCDQILAAFPDEKTYDFLCYSIGAVYAFELARKIQKIKGDDRVTGIVFIDSTPVAIKHAINLSKRLNSQVGGIKVNLGDFQAVLRKLDRRFGQKWRGNAISTSRKMYKSDEIEDPFTKFSYVAELDLEPRLKCKGLVFKAANFSTPLEAKLTSGLESCIDGPIEIIMAPGSHMDIMSASKTLIIETVTKFFPAN